MAPTLVPVTTSNVTGRRSSCGSSSSIHERTPTSYAPRAPPPDSTNPTRTMPIRTASRPRDRALPEMRPRPGDASYSAGRGHQPERRWARIGPGAKLPGDRHPVDARDEPLEQIVGGGHLRGKRGAEPFHQPVEFRIRVRIEGGHDRMMSKISARPGPPGLQRISARFRPGTMNARA